MDQVNGNRHYDIVIVGAGIIGLTLARELALRRRGRILILDKEQSSGRHASGRNSGVVHAGIYYPPNTLKAKLCVDGHRQLIEYVEANSLPILKCGKVIVAPSLGQASQLDELHHRALSNGVAIGKISLEELRKLEPSARSFGGALWSPSTAVIDSRAVLDHLVREIQGLGVDIRFDFQVSDIDPDKKKLGGKHESFSFELLYNTAGAQADRIAHKFGLGRQYRILPFKGMYWRSSARLERVIKRLIYPVPNLEMPFLGVHITRTVDGKVLFGPTAIPAFGRENYSLFGSLDWIDTPAISWNLAKMLIRNPQNVRSYVRQEMHRYRPMNFFKEAATLVGDLKPDDIGEFYKVGIRAQLVDLNSSSLVMDFLVVSGPSSIHVLNAVSPAFTSAFAFASHLADLQDRPTVAAEHLKPSH